MVAIPLKRSRLGPRELAERRGRARARPPARPPARPSVSQLGCSLLAGLPWQRGVERRGRAALPPPCLPGDG